MIVLQFKNTVTIYISIEFLYANIWKLHCKKPYILSFKKSLQAIHTYGWYLTWTSEPAPKQGSCSAACRVCVCCCEVETCWYAPEGQIKSKLPAPAQIICQWISCSLARRLWWQQITVTKQQRAAVSHKPLITHYALMLVQSHSGFTWTHRPGQSGHILSTASLLLRQLPLTARGKGASWKDSFVRIHFEGVQSISVTSATGQEYYRIRRWTPPQSGHTHPPNPVPAHPMSRSPLNQDRHRPGIRAAVIRGTSPWKDICREGVQGGLELNLRAACGSL